MSSYDDLYKIEVLPGGLLGLYELDDDREELENFDVNETFGALPGTDRYILKETYSGYIEVKEFVRQRPASLMRPTFML